MLRVNVTGRNKGIPCGKCGRKLGDVGPHAFVTHRSRGRRGAYCYDCGKQIQDSTVLEVGRQYVNGKGSATTKCPLTRKKAVPHTSAGKGLPTAFSQSRREPREAAGSPRFPCCLLDAWKTRRHG